MNEEVRDKGQHCNDVESHGYGFQKPYAQRVHGSKQTAVSGSQVFFENCFAALYLQGFQKGIAVAAQVQSKTVDVTIGGDGTQVNVIWQTSWIYHTVF